MRARRRLRSVVRSTFMRACARAAEKGVLVLPNEESVDGKLCMCPLGVLIFERFSSISPKDVLRYPVAEDARDLIGIRQQDAERFIEAFDGGWPLRRVERLAWRMRAGALASYGLTGFLAPEGS